MDTYVTDSRRGSGAGRPPLGRKDPRRRRGLPRLKGRKKGHWCLLNGCSTSFRHNMAINILKSCKSVFAYVKNRSFPSHIRSSFPWRPPLAEILDPRLDSISVIFFFLESICIAITRIFYFVWTEVLKSLVLNYSFHATSEWTLPADDSFFIVSASDRGGPAAGAPNCGPPATGPMM